MARKYYYYKELLLQLEERIFSVVHLSNLHLLSVKQTKNEVTNNLILINYYMKWQALTVSLTLNTAQECAIVSSMNNAKSSLLYEQKP